jgi:hypothetical protein
MPSLHEGSTGIGSWVPQLFYDIIARLVPGAVIIGALALAVAGPEKSQGFVQAWLNKPSSDYPSLIVVVGVGFVLSYALGIIFLGLCSPIEWLAFKLVKVEKDFVLKYDFVKQHDPPAGSRITKLKAEMHMTELLVLGFTFSLLINLFKMGDPGESRGLLALILLVAIFGSTGALRHFIIRQNRAVENYAQLLGYEEWKNRKNPNDKVAT